MTVDGACSHGSVWWECPTCTGEWTDEDRANGRLWDEWYNMLLGPEGRFW